jgi:hypothetical protein
MKTTTILLVLLTLLSCSKTDVDGCDCTKDTYKKVGTGLNFNLLYSEPVLCQDESDGWEGTGDSTIFFKIKCK